MGKATQTIKYTKTTKISRNNNNKNSGKHETQDCCVHKYHKNK